jgi:hypothetical protein
MSELLVWCVGLVKTKKFNGLHLRARDPTTKKKSKIKNKIKKKKEIVKERFTQKKPNRGLLLRAIIECTEVTSYGVGMRWEWEDWLPQHQ